MSPDTGFEAIASATVFAGELLRIDELTIRGAGGGVAKREVIRHPGSVAVLPIGAGELIFIRQFRAAVGRALLEIPAGLLDQAGESARDAAARECEEEVGYRPGRLTAVGSFLPTPGCSDERTWLFLGEDLTPTPVRPHGLEERAAEIVRLPMVEVRAMVAAGAIEDAKTLIAIGAWERRATDG